MLYFCDILDAFKTLTKNNIMHRDLKPHNILLHNGVIKIANIDFFTRYPYDLDQTIIGLPIYIPPEVINYGAYTTKGDIWSLGIIMY
jgi:serine/threonine protein kinase